MVATLTLLASGHASANLLEVGVNAGAKLNGMGGAGSAHVSGATATVVNPAGLAETGQLDANVSFVGMYGTSQAPANGPDTDVHATSFVPLPMITAAYRLTDRVAAGLFFYTPSGAGGTFDGVNYGVPGLPPRPFGLTMYDFEAGPVLACRLPWRINLGVAYRVSWIRGSLNAYDPSSLGSGSPLYAQTSMSGTDFTGFKIGAQANPIGRLKLGLVYRTPITVDLSGKTTGHGRSNRGDTRRDGHQRAGEKRGQAVGGRDLPMDRGRAPHLARLRTAVLQPLPRHHGYLGGFEHGHPPTLQGQQHRPPGK